MLWSSKTYEKYCNNSLSTGHFSKKRSEQSKSWMNEAIAESLQHRFYSNENIKNKINKVEQEVVEGKFNTFTGAKRLLDIYFNNT